MSDDVKNIDGVQIPVDPLLQLKRPARALLGWLSDEQAAHLFHGAQSGVALSDSEREFLRVAREHISKRAQFSENENPISPLPSELDNHIKMLRENPKVKASFGEGWDFKLVDISKVRALQPVVFINEAKQRVAGARAKDFKALAQITIPIPSMTKLPAQFDPLRNAWIFGSRNPNLRVAGHFAAEVQPGMTGYGFIVEIASSLMQVVKIENKYVLRDGYHRALGLISAGVSVIPALVREFGPYDDLGLPAAALLPRQLYMGDRPPIVTDYLDDMVSREIVLPATQRTIVIQGLELSHLG